MKAPVLSAVYMHYRGENLPDQEFLNNTLNDEYKIPIEKLTEFTTVFRESLKAAQLLEDHNGKERVLDASTDVSTLHAHAADGKAGKAGRSVSGDTCFVMMPFDAPLGNYYAQIYEPAIKKAGLNPMRADADIFGAGKIMDQIWEGITAARVLVAELTSKNPNVFYELGLAHALRKPVVLVSSNEHDVPFDLHHIRVIYYELTDPFWGAKLLDKVAENILSAINNPEEAIFDGTIVNAT